MEIPQKLRPGDLDRISEVLPHLCVGSYGAAEQAEVLTGSGITHAVCLLEELPGTIAALPHLHLPLSDHGESDLQAALAAAVPFIESAREAGGRVLIFCALGVNRSAALAAGYLRAVLGCSAAEAVSKVRSCRLFISIHHKYILQLSGESEKPIQGRGIEDCIQQALSEVKVLVQRAFDEAGVPEPGSAMDQAGLRNSALEVPGARMFCRGGRIGPPLRRNASLLGFSSRRRSWGRGWRSIHRTPGNKPRNPSRARRGSQPPRSRSAASP